MLKIFHSYFYCSAWHAALLIASGMNKSETNRVYYRVRAVRVEITLGWIMYQRQKSRLDPAASGYFSFIESLSRETLYAWF